MTMIRTPASPEAATRFLTFVNASPTPYHAVHNASLRLEKAGFRKVCTIQSAILLYLHLEDCTPQIREKDDWETDLKEGGKYYFTRSVELLVFGVTTYPAKILNMLIEIRARC